MTSSPGVVEATDQACPEPALLVERIEHIAVLTLNRPDVRNAISPEMACRLADAFEVIAMTRFMLSSSMRYPSLSESPELASTALLISLTATGPAP